MKIEKERKRSGWFSHKTTDVFITDDDKKFYDKTEAENWEWYLNNKLRILDTYKFGDVSPYTLGLHYIVDPTFSYKFFLDTYTKEKENDIVNYLYGHLKEIGIEYRKEKVDTMVKNHIKNKVGGWYVVILDKHYNRGNELHFFLMTDLVTSKVINEI